MKKAILVFCLFLASLLAASCSDDDRSCTSDGECFSGEVCAEGFCLSEDEINNGDTNNGATNNGGSNNGGSNNGGSNNGGTNNGGSNNGDPAPACIIDRFGNTCTEDDFEQEGADDTYDQNLLPYAPESWCDAGELVMPSRTFSATYCAGDTMDAYRFYIDNRSPDECLKGPFTVVITVDIKTECDPELVNVQVYDFFRDPVRNDLCEGEHQDVQCSESGDGQTRVFEWAHDPEQFIESKLLVEVTSRDDVQFEYDVTFEVIPQN